MAPVQGLVAWFDVVVSNPPYVASGAIARLQRDVRDWEPALALDGGIDGMDFHRRIVRDGVRHLREGGLLAVEVGAEQGCDVARLFRAHGDLQQVRVRRDYAGLPRVVAAERPSTSLRSRSATLRTNGDQRAIEVLGDTG